MWQRTKPTVGATSRRQGNRREHWTDFTPNSQSPERRWTLGAGPLNAGVRNLGVALPGGMALAKGSHGRLWSLDCQASLLHGLSLGPIPLTGQRDLLVDRGIVLMEWT